MVSGGFEVSQPSSLPTAAGFRPRGLRPTATSRWPS